MYFLSGKVRPSLSIQWSEGSGIANADHGLFRTGSRVSRFLDAVSRADRYTTYLKVRTTT